MLPLPEQPGTVNGVPYRQVASSGSGKAVGPAAHLRIDGESLATGGQEALPALPLLLHLFFQDQLAKA